MDKQLDRFIQCSLKHNSTEVCSRRHASYAEKQFGYLTVDSLKQDYLADYLMVGGSLHEMPSLREAIRVEWPELTQLLNRSCFDDVTQDKDRTGYDFKCEGIEEKICYITHELFWPFLAMFGDVWPACLCTGRTPGDSILAAMALFGCSAHAILLSLNGDVFLVLIVVGMYAVTTYHSHLLF